MKKKHLFIIPTLLLMSSFAFALATHSAPKESFVEAWFAAMSFLTGFGTFISFGVAAAENM